MIDLLLVKAHLRIDGTEEDLLIGAYVDAAVEYVQQHCDRRIVETPEDAGQMALTKDVEQAILLLVGHWYANREDVVVGVSVNQVPMGVQALLWTRKRF
ncbi:head-tail connector protein [Pseudomonas ovata]|uniref:head-tail connector protein n=1 Tax=Pseudomonas ovata TaxID=1839709 RepID=UPI000D693125|nr:head-tail connector protein [Pseudomonas ovata]